MAETKEPKFNLVGELTALGEWNTSTSLPPLERRAVLSPWLASLQNHVDEPLAKALGRVKLPPGVAEACELVGQAVLKGD